jgi:ABC-type multidrug transport system ATPase subunit/ABC-type multidrug transport system permease subunit
MGPSGSGKTSLLQSLAQRLHSTYFSEYRSSGDITVNSAIPSASVIKSIVSFVTQDDDALLSALTVRETLRFAAGLRLPSFMSKREKINRAEEVILKMGLKDCADSLIGDDLKKGISGGEKRRVSIAIQILTDPKVLLLDEPTSGLDVFTAMSVLDVIEALANEGRTIVMTIHQARSDMFKSFENVLLLARGGALVYTGKGEDMLPYFQKHGYECPVTTNPSDFALDLITVDLQEQEKEAASRAKVQGLIQAWQTELQPTTRSTSKIATPAELSSLKRQMNHFHITFPLVLQRSALNIKRNPEIMNARLSQVIGIAIVIAIFFAPLKSNQEAVQSRMGFLQELAAIYFVGVLQNIAVYPMERDMFYREQADGCYTSSTFLLSYTLLELPFTAATSLIFGILSAFAIRAKQSAAFFLISALNCFCIVTCGESVGIMFCTFFSHAGFSLNITSVFLTLSTVMAGIMSINIPAFLQAWNHLSPLKYMVSNMAPYSLHGMTFTCDPTQRINGSCPISTGEQALQLYKLNHNAWLNLVALAITTIVYRLVAYIVLKAATTRWDSDKLRLRIGKKSDASCTE